MFCPVRHPPTHIHKIFRLPACGPGKKPRKLLRMEFSPSDPVPQDPVSMVVLELAL